MQRTAHMAHIEGIQMEQEPRLEAQRLRNATAAALMAAWIMEGKKHVKARQATQMQ